MPGRSDKILACFRKKQEFMDTVVKQNIERYRKGTAYLKISDQDGKPVKNAQIQIKQTSHAFKYGANIFMLDELETKEKNDIYKESFKELFNIATVPFYWCDLEPEQGKPRYAVDSPKIYRRPPTDLCVNFCLENGIEPKCHCLNYDWMMPDWLEDADVDYHKKMLSKHFSELAERYADVIPSWEVTNETFDVRERRRSKFYKEDDFVEWSFRMADRYFPNNRLIINDFFIWENYRENRSAYYMQIERLMRNGISHLDSIGMQFHSFFKREDEENLVGIRYNPEFLYDVFDTYAKLGKKLQITEMTIPAYSNDAEDEEVQAELIENLYTVFFSHPAMEAVIYWNLVDGYAAFAPQGDMTTGENQYYGGLMRFDMSKKKSYDVIKNLFSKKWHTETACVTDENGEAQYRGFYGTYDVEITVDGKTVTKEIRLLENKNNKMKIVL